MALGKDDSKQLWESIAKRTDAGCKIHLHHHSDSIIDEFTPFNLVAQKLFHAPGANLRHIPIKIYLPAAAEATDSTGSLKTGHLRVVQSLVTPALSARNISHFLV
jgi:autophagy-related protein 5